MEYIILDLEWDSVYFPPEKRFINQILQIGAVKLDENLTVTDTFSVNVSSSLSNRVTSRFTKLTGITSEMMWSGIPFERAVEKYNAFCADADVTLTWSDSDLYTIVENEKILLKDKLEFEIKSYLDLQKLVQDELYNKGYESKNQVALEAAAEFLGVDTEEYELHTALDDCRLSAKLFEICYTDERFSKFLRNAESPDFRARLSFKPYPISDINDKHIRRCELEFCCPKCKEKARKLNPWKYRNRWFVANFKCDSCGFKFNGRVAFKKTFDDLQVKHKVCEYKPKKRKKDAVQYVSEKVQSTQD